MWKAVNFGKNSLKLKLLDGDEWPTYMQMRLEQIDEWFVNHGIDPETIQLSPEEIEEANRIKEEGEAVEKKRKEAQTKEKSSTRKKKTGTRPFRKKRSL